MTSDIVDPAWSALYPNARHNSDPIWKYTRESYLIGKDHKYRDIKAGDEHLLHVYMSNGRTPNIEDATYPQSCQRGYTKSGRDGNQTNWQMTSDGCRDLRKSGNGIFSKSVTKGGYACTQTAWAQTNKELCCSGFLDSRFTCDPKWCPMSKECANSEATIHRCSQSDTTGNSVLITDTQCNRWCKDNPGSCDSAKTTFCQNNPDHKLCKCIFVQKQKDYIELTKQSRKMGLSPPRNAHCWYSACEGEDLMTTLKTSAIVKEQLSCDNASNIYCNQIINIQKGAKNNQINKNDFEQACGIDFSNPSSDDPHHSTITNDESDGSNTAESIDGSTLTSTEVAFMVTSGMLTLLLLTITTV